MFLFPAFSRISANCSITPRLVGFESAYSILSRFASANVVSGAAVVGMFKNHSERFRSYRSRTNNLSSLYSVNIGAFERELSLAKREVYDLFLTPNYLHDHWSLCGLLRFCPCCMSQGVHYAVFQFDKLVNCPIHKVPLEVACRFCGAATPYTLNSQTFRTPFGCASCKCSLLQGDYRMSSSALQAASGLPLEVERIYKTFSAMAGSRLCMPLLGASRVRAGQVIPAMRLEVDCGEEEEQFFSSMVSAPMPHSILRFDFISRVCQTDLPHPPEVGGSEFTLLVDELASVLKSLIRHNCFVEHVSTRTVALVSDNDLIEHTVQSLTNSIEGLKVLVSWRRLWCVNATFRGRAAIGYAISSWLGRFCQESRTLALSAKERSWLAKHAFADEVLHSLTEFRRNRKLDAGLPISDQTAYVAPCWAVEVDEDDPEIRRISYTRQAAV
ncbi:MULTISPECIES: TniQ family protein [unclassified Pseudomonas]|uniref:TniQ family protein n=1 Tax=unclassified Pseudomonas TaxID=196821 RepID=UPI0024483CCE|nr:MULTISPECIES: TniQ family protein [unclassified Pseudomonas]MDG9925694.1 TniQ family protein [Pseudomonas sp. GD04045]MDH0037189.1 TniQ family protein [Pseudomonas sp. GD04019]